MTIPQVFVTRQIPADLSPLKAIAQVEVWPEPTPPPASLLQTKAQTMDGLLCLLTDPIDQTLITNAPRLKVISQMAVGYDNIDVAAATAQNIPVGHTPGILTRATADLTWALLMAAARRVVEGDRYTRSGQWQTWEPSLLLGPDVGGATLGIIGMGRIGQAVSRRALGFEMTVLYHSHRRQPQLEETLGIRWTSLDTLLQQADFVSLHCPLTPETHHLIDDRAFSLMKRSAILINTARGSIVDPVALHQALHTQAIAGAALDVTVPEPIPLDSPLLDLTNLIITPHIGSASQATREKMATMAMANLMAGLAGKPLPHCVNPEVYGSHK
jgi:glyoxylate reductase